MSYSKWGSSYWYTFWATIGDVVPSYDTESFCICGVSTFTSKDLRDDLDSCMSKVSLKCPSGDIFELKLYVSEFLSDVDFHYGVH